LEHTPGLTIVHYQRQKCRPNFRYGRCNYIYGRTLLIRPAFKIIKWQAIILFYAACRDRPLLKILAKNKRFCPASLASRRTIAKNSMRGKNKAS
jgi:hypothetical protein